MNVKKVINELQLNCMADPFECEIARMLIKKLKDGKSVLPRLLIHLLKMAEEGKFRGHVGIPAEEIEK